MINSNKQVFGGMIIAGSALILSACATVDGTSASAAEPAETAKTQAVSADKTATESGMAEMKAECMVMHEKMKAKMAEGGMKGEGMRHGEMGMKGHHMSPEKKAEMHTKMAEGGMMGHQMSPEKKAEMHAKHMKCMEMMPEMHAKMKEQCAAKHKDGGMEQCKMMQHDTPTNEGETK